MKKIIIILLFSWICIANTCKKVDNANCHYSIDFSNNSEKKLHVRDAYHHPLWHPEPFDIEKLSYTAHGEIYIVNSGEQNNRSAMWSRDCHEKIFKRDTNYGTVFVYVFDAEVIENTSWEIVARDYLVLKRYDLTLEDLKNLEFEITYPPDERMKDMKMYPPYRND